VLCVATLCSGVHTAYKSKGYLHPIIKLFTATVLLQVGRVMFLTPHKVMTVLIFDVCVLQYLGILLNLIDLVVYTENGIGIALLSFVGESMFPLALHCGYLSMV